jgi:phenylpropionate dioxygenase-like ring-hydroxylating dioxygenase large terminal subunit
VIDSPSAEARAAYYSALQPLWHPVATVAELGETPLAARLLGRPLVLVRLEGEVCCFDDVCRHLGSALSIGEVLEGRLLRCAYHGWTYERGGRCVDIPARRGAAIPREARVRAYPVRVAQDLVWVCLAGDSGVSVSELPDLPDFPEFYDTSFRVTAVKAYPPWRASAPRVIMAGLDDTHFPWVHPGLLGDRDHPEPPEHSVERTAGGLVSSYTIEQPAPHAGAGAVERVSYSNHVTPGTIRLVKRSSAGTYVIRHATCPLAHDATVVYLQTARDFDTGSDRDGVYLEFEDVIQSQDRPVVESQRPWLLPPLSSRLLLYVRPADLPLIAFQQWLEELGVPQL